MLFVDIYKEKDMKRLALLLGSLLSVPAVADANKAMDLYLNQNYQQAFNLFLDTAHLGHAKSQFNIGVQYLRGQGVKADPIMAYSYLTLALDNGFMMAKQARLSVEKRLSETQLLEAEKRAQALIKLYGAKGTDNLENKFVYARSVNPTPKRTINPDAEYPSGFTRDGIPGFASYLFDIDRNGVPRDLVLLQSYPDAAFGQSIKEKLENSRYQILKVSGTLRTFTNAQFSGVFRSDSMSPETKANIVSKQKQLLGQAKAGDINAQAELASMLTLMGDVVEYVVELASEQVVAAQELPIRIFFKDEMQPSFSYDQDIEGNFHNFSYLVWVDPQGKVSKKKPFYSHAVPQQLIDNALATLEKWQLTYLEPQKVKAEQGPYLVEFFYNNEPKNTRFSNYLTRSNVSIKAVVNKPKEQLADYWRKEAAKGGHAESLFLLGANCNLPLLSVAAKNEFLPAQVQAAKCILQNDELTTDEQQLVENWLQQASGKGSLIAKRELAGLYARTSNMRSELEQAIALGKEVIDEIDDPWMLEFMAAAYAKLGQFEDAVSLQKQAVKQAWSKDYFMAPFEQRLMAYENSEIAPW